MKEHDDVVEYTDTDGNLHILNDNDDGKKVKSKKLIITVVIVLLVAMASVFIYTNRNTLSLAYISQWVKSDVLGINKGPGYPVPIVGNTVEENNSGMLNRYFSYISDTTFAILNTTAGEVSNVQHGYSEPAVKFADTKAISYDLGGYAYSVESAGGTLYNGKSEEKIYSAAISESGVYGLINATGGFLSNVQIYDKNNKFLYSYKMSEYYAIAMSINSSGTRCAVSGVNTKGGKITTQIYILDFTKEKPLATFSFDNNIVLDVMYLNNGKLACIGDSSSYVIDIDNKKPIEYNYKGKTLSTYAIKDGYGIALSLSPSEDGKDCTVVNIDINGSVACEIDTGISVTAIDVCENSKNTALYSRGYIYLYNSSGKQIAKTECSKDVKSIVMINDTSAYIVGVSEIGYVDLTE